MTENGSFSWSRFLQIYLVKSPDSIDFWAFLFYSYGKEKIMTTVTCRNCNCEVDLKHAHIQSEDIEVGSTGDGYSIHAGKLGHFGIGASYNKGQKQYRHVEYFLCQKCFKELTTDSVWTVFFTFLFILFCLYYTATKMF